MFACHLGGASLNLGHSIEGSEVCIYGDRSSLSTWFGSHVKLLVPLLNNRHIHVLCWHLLNRRQATRLDINEISPSPSVRGLSEVFIVFCLFFPSLHAAVFLWSKNFCHNYVGPLSWDWILYTRRLRGNDLWGGVPLESPVWELGGGMESTFAALLLKAMGIESWRGVCSLLCKICNTLLLIGNKTFCRWQWTDCYIKGSFELSCVYNRTVLSSKINL